MPSFDVVSKVDMAELKNAVNQTRKELEQRYDFRDAQATIDELGEEGLTLKANSEGRVDAIKDTLQSKLVKRGISLKSVTFGKTEPAGGAMQKLSVTLVNGIEKEFGKKIIKFIKDAGLKVEAQIQGDQLRVTGKKKDDLQAVMAALKAEEFEQPLQFVNFRD